VVPGHLWRCVPAGQQLPFELRHLGHSKILPVPPQHWHVSENDIYPTPGVASQRRCPCQSSNEPPLAVHSPYRKAIKVFLKRRIFQCRLHGHYPRPGRQDPQRCVGAGTRPEIRSRVGPTTRPTPGGGIHRPATEKAMFCVETALNPSPYRCCGCLPARSGRVACRSGRPGLARTVRASRPGFAQSNDECRHRVWIRCIPLRPLLCPS